MWDHCGGERKGEFPGGPDAYRSTLYSRNYEKQTFEVLYSKVEAAAAA
jgi:hypothetical protein